MLKKSENNGTEEIGLVTPTLALCEKESTDDDGFPSQTTTKAESLFCHGWQIT